MLLIWEAGIGFGVYDLYPHALHKTAGALYANVIVQPLQRLPYSPFAVEGAFGVNLINLIHQEQVFRINAGNVIRSTVRNTEKF